MKMIEQSVRIIRPTSFEQGINELRYIEYAGRNCYDSYDKMNAESYQKFVKFLMTNGHGSPLEFGHMHIEIVTSRDVLAELTRHRLSSFAVRSQRYVRDNKTGEISFIRPLLTNEKYTDEQKALFMKGWEKSMKNAENAYVWMLEQGATPEDARKVLPNSAATVINMDANLREWLHIFELRTAIGVYPETRAVMQAAVNAASAMIPYVFDQLKEDVANNA